ncbi:MAG: rhomboid family intramembrane serine protease [Haloferula sp.]
MRGGSASKWGVLGRDILEARTTLLVVLILVVIQFLLERVGGSRDWPEIFLVVGLSRQGLLEGLVWQPFSYAWIHGNWVHLMINAFGLLAIGPRIERIGGGRLVLMILVGGLLAGGLVHLLIGGEVGLTPLVGMSGGVTAMLLWLTGVSPGSKMWPLPVSGKNLGIGLLLASAILALMNPSLGIPYLSGVGRMLGGYADGSVSHACHLGGGLLGWGMARWTLRPRVTLATLQKERARRESAGGPDERLMR